MQFASDVNPLRMRRCQIWWICREMLWFLLLPFVYLNHVYVVLWSLGPAEPPPSSVFSYSINCWISKKQYFSTENLASSSLSPTYNEWKRLSKCFWWVLTKTSGSIWRSFLKAIGLCFYTTNYLTAFLRLGLFKIQTHIQKHCFRPKTVDWTVSF